MKAPRRLKQTSSNVHIEKVYNEVQLCKCNVCKFELVISDQCHVHMNLLLQVPHNKKNNVI